MSLIFISFILPVQSIWWDELGAVELVDNFDDGINQSVWYNTSVVTWNEADKSVNFPATNGGNLLTWKAYQNYNNWLQIYTYESQLHPATAFLGWHENHTTVAGAGGGSSGAFYNMGYVDMVQPSAHDGNSYTIFGYGWGEGKITSGQIIQIAIKTRDDTEGTEYYNRTGQIGEWGFLGNTTMKPDAYNRLGVWNYCNACTPATLKLYNITLINLSGIPPPAVTYDLNVILTDENKNILDYANDEILEQEPFLIFANFTIDEISFPDASCQFTAKNISAHFALLSDSNFTLSDSDNQLDLIVTESYVDLVADIFEFDVCRLNVLEEVEILINGVLYEEINRNSIPLCSVGKYSYINSTLQFDETSVLNISIQCSGCNGLQKQMTILRDEDNKLLFFDRHYSEHSEFMYYNLTSELYQFINNSHHYQVSDADLGNITVNCDNNITEIIFNVLNVNLSIEIIEINNTAFYDGIEIERGNNITVLIDVSGDLIDFLQFNITTANSSLLTTANNFITLQPADLLSIGRYNISIFAVDNEGIGVSHSGFFIINDTQIPVVAFAYPLADNSSTDVNTGSITIDFTANDNADLYSIDWNITKNSTGDLMFNQTVFTSGLSYAVVEVIDTSSWDNTTFILDAEVCDSHTKEEIEKAKSIIKTTDTLKYQFGNTNVNIQSLNGYEDSTETIKLKDRYTFKFKYSDKIFLKKYKLSSNNDIVYLPSSKYKGHFIINNEYWIDFEQAGDVIVSTDDSGNWIIEVDNPDNEITFNSIGKLNCISQSVIFELTTAEVDVVTAPSLVAYDLTELTNVVLVVLIGLLWIAVMALGFFFRNFGFASFGFLLGLVLGFMLSGIGIILTLIFWLLNIVMFAKYAVKFK